MAVVTTSDLLALWTAHAAGAELAGTRHTLEVWRGAAWQSPSSVAHLDALLVVLGENSASEWSAWWQVLCGWSYGFPPDPALVPDRPGDSQVRYCPTCGRRSCVEH